MPDREASQFTYWVAKQTTLTTSRTSWMAGSFSRQKPPLECLFCIEHGAATAHSATCHTRKGIECGRGK